MGGKLADADTWIPSQGYCPVLGTTFAIGSKDACVPLSAQRQWSGLFIGWCKNQRTAPDSVRLVGSLGRQSYGHGWNGFGWVEQ